MRLALLASGTGSNVEALLRKTAQGQLPRVEWTLLGSDRPQAPVVEKAQQAGLSTWNHSPKEFLDKASYEEALHQELIRHQTEGIVLAGYMRLVGPTLLQYWMGRILNLHPSLLPSFPGRNAIQDALRYRVKLSGCTVHFVDEGVDTGPIIAQQAVPVWGSDTEESLGKRIHEVEHQLLPATVRRWSEEQFWWQDGRVHFADETGELR